MKVHDVCSIFPMMSPDEFAGLKADISANGQHEPVWTYRGMVIDGRNRLKACSELGIEPKVSEWDGKGSMIEFVVSLNLHRRHLSSGQRAACGTEIEERLAIEAKERQREAGPKAAEKRSEPINGNSSHKGRPAKDVASSTVGEIVPQPSGKVRAHRPRDQAAKLVGSNSRYIQDAKTVKAASAELHEKVKAGTVTLPQAKREVARVAKRADLEAKARDATAARVDDVPTWEIIVGDCLGILAETFNDNDAWVSPIPSSGARLIFADPPYNIGFDYGDGPKADLLDPLAYLEWCREWISSAVDRLADDGSMWVLINDEWADEFGCILRGENLHRRSWIKWYESFGVNTPNNFNRCSRHLFYMVKDKTRFVFNADAVRRPSDRQTKYGDKRADLAGKVWDNVWGITPPLPRLVDNAKERLPDFPTQLPVDLLMAVVGCASDPGDLVLDLFSGSGTAGEAAIRLGRRYIGIEKSASFARLAKLRLEATKENVIET